MGNCGGSDNNTKLIDKNYKDFHYKDQNIIKLLMLGSGASGKSTLFKQLGWLYGIDDKDKIFSESEADERLCTIRSNMTQNIVVLLRKSQELYDIDNKLYNKCFVDFDKNESKNIINNIKLVAKFQNENFQLFQMNKTDKEIQELGVAIGELWKLPQIKETFKHRDKFSFSDNMDYFYEKSEKVFNSNYKVNEQDFLRTRVRTTGVNKIKLEIQNKNNSRIFEIIDVGGQRNERNKWIHQFDNVVAVLFVAALDHYATVLFEDETENAMQESLDLFEQIVTLKHFTKTEMILFLNKQDLFIKTLKSGQHLSMCFDSEINQKWKGIQWDGNRKGLDYNPNKYIDDEKQDNEYFDQCYQYAVEFITKRYQEKNNINGKMIYCHITNSCDKDIVTKVFADVQSIVIRAGLQRSGIIVE